MSKKGLRSLFRVFARVCVHAFGAHLPLEKCKNQRTGRRFMRIDEGEGTYFSPTGSVFDSLDRLLREPVFFILKKNNQTVDFSSMK